MPIMDFTLIPGGAFMMCESISEFDENIPAQTAEPTPEEIKRVEAVGMRTDWIISTTNDLGEIYRSKVMPLMSMELNPVDVTDTVALADKISGLTSEIIECLQKVFLKVRSAYDYLCSDKVKEEYLFGAVKDHLGIIIKSMNAIRKGGYDHISTLYRYHPVFGAYDTNQVINALLSAPDLLKDCVIDQNVIMQFVSMDSPIITNFSDIQDLLNVTFNDPDRRSRQERVETRTYTIDDIIKYHIVHDRGITCDSNTTNCVFMKHMSHVLRKVKQKCYNLQVEMSEVGASGNAEHTNRCMYSCGVSVVNTFILGTLLILGMAYELNNLTNTHNDIESWMNEVLKVAKNH